MGALPGIGEGPVVANSAVLGEAEDVALSEFMEAEVQLSSCCAWKLDWLARLPCVWVGDCAWLLLSGCRGIGT